MRRVICFFLLLNIGILLSSCAESQKERQISFAPEIKSTISLKTVPEEPVANEIILENYKKEPSEWGEQVTGVKTRMNTSDKKLALTFDACGGPYGNSFDEELISFLRKEEIAATLFINEQWVLENEEIFLDLAADPLFQIENHGTDHVPLSVSGGEAWGIRATESPKQVYDEIMHNHETVEKLTGKQMELFRSGTAYYDEVAVKLANDLGYEVVNFDILGDAGATYTDEQVKNALLHAKPGSIALLHMNQPQSGTAEGVKKAIPLLKQKGFQFVQLGDELLE